MIVYRIQRQNRQYYPFSHGYVCMLCRDNIWGGNGNYRNIVMLDEISKIVPWWGYWMGYYFCGCITCIVNNCTYIPCLSFLG